MSQQLYGLIFVHLSNKFNLDRMCTVSSSKKDDDDADAVARL
jgi:hypothetical protein